MTSSKTEFQAPNEDLEQSGASGISQLIPNLPTHLMLEVFSQSGLGVIAICEQNVVFINSAAVEFLNLKNPPAHYLEQNFLILETEIPDKIENLLQPGHQSNIKINSRSIQTQHFELSDAHSRHYHLLTFANDQQSMSDRQRQLMELGSMTAKLVHEINNPLAIMQGKLAQVKRAASRRPESFDQETAENIKKVEFTCHRITQMVKGVRAFIRNEKHSETLEVRSLQDLIIEAIEFCHSKVHAGGVSLMLPFIGQDVFLECRPIQISQALINIINNACDAVADSESKWIEIEVENLNDKVAIKISNSGPRIPEDLQRKIMEPFFTTKGDKQGTGLGLTITQEIMESHHGSLSLDNHQENTCFVLTLPKSQEHSELTSLSSAMSSIPEAK